MALWFETKVSYDKTQDNGLSKKVTETYLVDALTFTEAESKITSHLTKNISGDYTVKAVKKTKIREVFNKDADRFWLAKIGFRIFDDKSLSDILTVSDMIIGAKDFDDAYEDLGKEFKDEIADWEIIGLNESSVIEIVE